MRFRSLVSSLLIGIASLAVAAGCDSPSEPELDLLHARAKWAANAPPSYSYTVAQYCFCLPEWIGPVVVVVRDGVVESRTYVATSAPVPSAQYWDRFATVDTLFARLLEAQQNRPVKVIVTYDAQYGFPNRIDVDPDAHAVDGGYTLVASNFQAR